MANRVRTNSSPGSTRHKCVQPVRCMLFPFRIISRTSRAIGRTLAVVLVVSMLLMPTRILLAEEAAATVDQLLPLVGGALVETGQQNWATAAAELKQFSQLWDDMKDQAPAALATDINVHLAAAIESVQQQNAAKAKESLSALANKVNAYVDGAQSTKDKPSGKDAAELLLGMVKKTHESLTQGSIEQAQTDYRKIVNDWKKIENPIRNDNFAVYSQLETKMTLIRVALQADPPKAKQAQSELTHLIAIIKDYKAGKMDGTAGQAAQTHRLSDVLVLLQQADQALQANDADLASQHVQAFITIWPAVEGEVSISSTTVYTDTENQMSEVQGYLLSSPPQVEQARTVIGKMLPALEAIASTTSYNAWDAAVILLREGLEAILVLAALLAYVKRTDNKTARHFIWAGAGTGLVVSAVLAVLLTYTIAQVASGSTRELIEGITGLFAVVMMLTIGNWLHSKSNMQSWNAYIGKQVDGALAKGSLWSLFAVSGLAILREGAETAIFYVGMAPSIEPLQLVLGIAGALLVLVILGFALIYFSAKLPIRPFFMAATALIYYLVVRFLGESIHSLQIAGQIPAHSEVGLPSVSWLGAYPTWETFGAQMIALLVIAYLWLRGSRRTRK
ncbi:FTR1 family iron permease [Paenibacillus taiwanensis]|uniref:FTR1 family iron permease n=1 Tax=Paenibacillus taiwanensis TaxID=401638 RepID=UPI000406648B|nr:FTR1 family protein [Paenibacillus taiwanensis]